ATLPRRLAHEFVNDAAWRDLAIKEGGDGSYDVRGCWAPDSFAARPRSTLASCCGQEPTGSCDGGPRCARVRAWWVCQRRISCEQPKTWPGIRPSSGICTRAPGERRDRHGDRMLYGHRAEHMECRRARGQ